MGLGVHYKFSRQKPFISAIFARRNTLAHVKNKDKKDAENGIKPLNG